MNFWNVALSIRNLLDLDFSLIRLDVQLNKETGEMVGYAYYEDSVGGLMYFKITNDGKFKQI